MGAKISRSWFDSDVFVEEAHGDVGGVPVYIAAGNGWWAGE
jgi:hypothetical protein